MGKTVTLLLIVSTLFSPASPAGQEHRTSQARVSEWRTFSSKAGWTINYPSGWRVASCTACSDPSEADVFVTITNPSTNEAIMIDNLAEKPSDQSAEQWLDEVSKTTNRNPVIAKERFLLATSPALRVVNSGPGSTQSENVYLVHGSTTCAIRFTLKISSDPLFRKMLSTFQFAGR